MYSYVVYRRDTELVPLFALGDSNGKIANYSNICYRVNILIASLKRRQGEHVPNHASTFYQKHKQWQWRQFDDKASVKTKTSSLYFCGAM